MSETPSCWADPLTRAERHALRKLLASAALHAAGTASSRRARRKSLAGGMLATAHEAADLHLDVTERAAVATS